MSRSPKAAPPSVFDFTDYREFLKAYCDHRRQVSPRFSFRTLTRRMGMNSPNYVQRIIRGERQPGPKFVDKITRALGFDREETSYFIEMVSMSREAVASDKCRRESHRRQNARRRPRFYDVEALGKWYNFVIWELASCHDFPLTPAAASKALSGRVSEEQASAAIAMLVTRGYLIETDVRGRYTQCNATHFSLDEKRDLVLREDHSFFSKLATQKVAAPVDKREFQGITIALSKERFRAAKERIKAFTRTLLIELANDPDADDVYRINLHLFAITSNDSLPSEKI